MTNPNSPDASDHRRAAALIRCRATDDEDGMMAYLTAGIHRGPKVVTAVLSTYIKLVDELHTSDDHLALVAQLDQFTHAEDVLLLNAACMAMVHGISVATGDFADLDRLLDDIVAHGRIGTLTGSIIDLHAELLPSLREPRALRLLTQWAAKDDDE